MVTSGLAEASATMPAPVSLARALSSWTYGMTWRPVVSTDMRSRTKNRRRRREGVWR
jgi:hypothetical protein